MSLHFGLHIINLAAGNSSSSHFRTHVVVPVGQRIESVIEHSNLGLDRSHVMCLFFGR